MLVRPGRLMTRGAAAAFSPPLALPHLWLDPSDLSTLFQDSAMTTPVTADGDPVGAILDKSGNGHHLTQATADSRPTYQTDGTLHWLEFPATDDFLEVTLALNQPYTRVSAWRSGPSDTTGNFWAGINCDLYINSGQFVMWMGGSDFNTGLTIGTSEDFVATEIVNGASSSLAIDSGSAVTGNPGSDAISNLRISTGDGRLGVEGMRFSGGILLNEVASASDIALLRTYLAAKQGRVL